MVNATDAAYPGANVGKRRNCHGDPSQDDEPNNGARKSDGPGLPAHPDAYCDGLQP